MWDDNTRTRTELVGWIKRKLGCGVVSVELTDEQLDDSVRDAEEFWQMWVGVVKSVDTVTTSDNVIPAASIAADLDSVVNVLFETTGDTLGQYFGWADVEFNPLQNYYGAGSQGGYSNLVQYMAYMEDAKRVLSSDWDWDWDRTKRVLTLSPSTMASGRRIRIIYLSREMSYAYLSSYEWKLFRDYALAKAMKTLAIIRMKYSDKPSATGSFAMDGDSMYANAEAIEVATEDKMRQMQRPVGFFAE